MYSTTSANCRNSVLIVSAPNIEKAMMPEARDISFYAHYYDNKCQIPKTAVGALREPLCNVPARTGGIDVRHGRRIDHWRRMPYRCS